MESDPNTPFLTEPGDVVLDIFAGPNTTGVVCEAEKRNWLAFEQLNEFASASVFRFIQDKPIDEIKKVFDALTKGGSISIPSPKQGSLI